MENLLNNFYVEWTLFILFIVLIAIASVDILKKKYNTDIKNKLNYKNIDFKFLLKMLFLSLGLRIIFEHYLIPISESDAFIPNSVLQLVVLFVATCLFAPVCEEIIFRFGIYEYINKKGMSNIFNMIITSIIFAIIHFYGINAIIILIIISYIWNYAYFKTNNLLYPILLHFIHNVYALICNYIPNNNFYLYLELICLIGYIIITLKNSNKKATVS